MVSDLQAPGAWKGWWALQDLNLRPTDLEEAEGAVNPALTLRLEISKFLGLEFERGHRSYTEIPLCALALAGP